MKAMVDFAIAERIVQNVAALDARGRDLRAHTMRMLSEIPTYNWVGVYRLDGDTLVLDEFVGAATDHTHIPVGRGVCGTAVAEDRNMVVDDVRELDNYLACSTQTRSEIVVLIRDTDGKVLGQIDVDGHEVGAFDLSDEEMLERIGSVLAERWT
jgi:L-methionine (R)-S-oxide reductase